MVQAQTQKIKNRPQQRSKLLKVQGRKEEGTDQKTRNVVRRGMIDCKIIEI